jgi:hypothetical protein
MLPFKPAPSGTGTRRLHTSIRPSRRANVFRIRELGRRKKHFGVVRAARSKPCSQRGVDSGRTHGSRRPSRRAGGGAHAPTTPPPSSETQLPQPTLTGTGGGARVEHARRSRDSCRGGARGPIAASHFRATLMFADGPKSFLSPSDFAGGRHFTYFSHNLELYGISNPTVPT